MEVKMLVRWGLLLLGLVSLVRADSHGNECTPDFNNVMPSGEFDEDDMMGTWYQTRWYLGAVVNNISDEPWDLSATFYKKGGNPNHIFFKINMREKTKKFCMDEADRNMTRVRPGQYNIGGSITTGMALTSTFMFMTKYFMVEFMCHNPSSTGCGDVAAAFWSKTKKARHQDTAKAAMVLKGICYPDMKRFVDMTHEMDCVPPEKMKCGMERKGHRKGKRYMRRRGHGMDDDDDDCDMRGKGRGKGRYDDDDHDDDRGMRRRRRYDDDDRRMRRRRGDDDDDDDRRMGRCRGYYDDDDCMRGKGKGKGKGRMDDDDDEWGMKRRHRDDDDDNDDDDRRMRRRRRDRDDDDDDDDDCMRGKGKGKGKGKGRMDDDDDEWGMRRRRRDRDDDDDDDDDRRMRRRRRDRDDYHYHKW